MLSLHSIEALANCTLKNGLIKLDRVLDNGEYVELRHALRTTVLDSLIPFYKPIAIKVCSTKFRRVTNIDKDLDESYIGMIPQLNEAVIMPDEPVVTDPGDWNKIDDQLNKMFNTSRVIASCKVPTEQLLYSKSYNSGPQRVSDFKYMVDKNVNGSTLSKESLKPLLRDSSPIVTISDNDTKSITLEMVFARSIGSITYMDIEKTIGTTKAMYMPVSQTYSLDEYLTISLINNSNDEIQVGYKRDIDESVLQAILRGFANSLLVKYNEQINNKLSPVYKFSNGDVCNMWKDVNKCW